MKKSDTQPKRQNKKGAGRPIKLTVKKLDKLPLSFEGVTQLEKLHKELDAQRAKIESDIKEVNRTMVKFADWMIAKGTKLKASDNQ